MLGGSYAFTDSGCVWLKIFLCKLLNEAVINLDIQTFKKEKKKNLMCKMKFWVHGFMENVNN